MLAAGVVHSIKLRKPGNEQITAAQPLIAADLLHRSETSVWAINGL